jgi:hypothetical protein
MEERIAVVDVNGQAKHDATAVYSQMWRTRRVRALQRPITRIRFPAITVLALPTLPGNRQPT